MSSPTSNYNSKITTLDTVIRRENLNYILEFRLLINIAQHIDSQLILYDIHIYNPIIASYI